MLRFILALSLIHAVVGQCNRPDDKFIGDLCYSISNTKLKFTDAQTACYQTNENLAVVHTTIQANFLASMVRTQTGAPEGKFWIGLSRPSTGSRFQWDDGTTMSWSNFDSSLPRDNLYVAESTINGKWQTLDGQQPLYFVCSYVPGGVTPGWPLSTMGYGTTGYPASVPVSDSTGFPASVPVSGPTRYPASVPYTDSTGLPTGYPASIPVSGPTGYPASVTVSDSTGYPASVTVSGPTGYPASVPVSDSTGYPGSVPVSGPTGYPASVPYTDSTEYPASVPVSGATGGPVSYPPSGVPITGYPTFQPSQTPSFDDADI